MWTCIRQVMCTTLLQPLQLPLPLPPALLPLLLLLLHTSQRRRNTWQALTSGSGHGQTCTQKAETPWIASVVAVRC